LRLRSAPGSRGGRAQEVPRRADERIRFTGFGVFGYVARGVVFVLIGYSLIKAAVDFNPDAAVTLDGALSKFAHADYGPLLLGVVSAGLIGFGLYALADARYRKV